jgi:hypothetical protein
MKVPFIFPFYITKFFCPYSGEHVEFQGLLQTFRVTITSGLNAPAKIPKDRQFKITEE